jgi:hypothetical protein
VIEAGVGAGDVYSVASCNARAVPACNTFDVDCIIWLTGDTLLVAAIMPATPEVFAVVVGGVVFLPASAALVEKVFSTRAPSSS